MKRTRRAIGLGAVAAVALALPLACGGSGSEEGGTVQVSVGRQPFAGGNSPVTDYMMDNDLFEKAAAELGQEIEVDYRDYPSAIPQVEAMVGGKLDFGMWGNTPIVRAIAQQQEITPLSMGEGHLRFVLATRKGSGIHNMSDLRGKTVGVLLGGDPQAAFAQMLRWTEGTADPAELDIKLINTPSQAVAATVPKGMDATLVGYPALLKEQAKNPDIVGVANTFGYTEEAYRGPAGAGEGHLMPSVRQSPFYPDGFYLHRSLWVVHNDVLEQNPKVATAFLMALEEATRAMTKEDPKDVAARAQKYWELSPDDGAKVVDDELLFIRGWSWTTSADAWGVMKVSEFMAQSNIIEEPLSWSQITEAFQRGAAVTREAYERVGKRPKLPEFTEQVETDLRGRPTWQVEQWRTPDQIGG